MCFRTTNHWNRGTIPKQDVSSELRRTELVSIGRRRHGLSTTLRGLSRRGRVLFGTDDTASGHHKDAKAILRERRGQHEYGVDRWSAATGRGLGNRVSADGSGCFRGRRARARTHRYQGRLVRASRRHFDLGRSLWAERRFESSYRGTSADGSRVFFATDEQLEPDDTDTKADLYERAGGITTLVSIGSAGGNGALDSSYRGASADGTRVFFGTDERMHASDRDAKADLYERAGGVTTLVYRFGRHRRSTPVLQACRQMDPRFFDTLDAGAYRHHTSLTLRDTVGPVFPRRQIKTTWRLLLASHDLFTARSDAARACMRGRRVEVQKVGRGRDRTVATARTTENGNWRAAGVKDATGSFRAVLTEEVRKIGDSGAICGPGKSRTIRP